MEGGESSGSSSTQPPEVERPVIRLPGKKQRDSKNLRNNGADVTDTAVPEPEIPLAFPGSSLAGIDLKKELKGRFSEDTFFKKILDSPKEFKNFIVEDDVVYMSGSTRPLLCVPKVQIGEKSARELVIDEAHSLLAHLGSAKTLSYLRNYVWWK
ncbi:hypothetical protein BDN72DRAFT_779200, partial [Pluteus cervinus]